MKTMKRIVATFVAVLMIATTLLTVNVFADAVTFPDVADDYVYKNAIYSLVQKGIINGIQQEDGTFIFKPDATITRAEFAKMITVALAGNVTLTEKTDKFPDVADSHWANTYIAYAVKAGIINGRDDGTFRPENPVTYGEAIKMLVCAKGYGSLYAQAQMQGQPWYFGYIKIANDINLTKSAQALGDAQAPRGMVAQLIYNMDYTKKIDVTTPGDGPEIDLGEDDEYEEASGVVVAVVDTSLTGENYGLNKFQIMIDDTVYNVGKKLTVDSFYDYLGVMIDFEYSEDKDIPVIERVTEFGRNESVTIQAEDIDSVKDGVIEYYESENARKTTEAKLADDLYVIYNGQGVAQKDITNSFIEKYFDIECGEIRLENNDGGKDYEIAYVTSYDTYYVTGRTVNKDLYTFTDSYASKSVTLENDEDSCVVYKVATAGGEKKQSTVTGISSSKVVLSVAKPLGNGVAEAIVSTATLKNAEVDEMSGYDEITIDGKEYKLSRYYEELLEKDSDTYNFKVGDRATFYLDYAGRIVFMTKSESTDPYAYVLGFDTGSGINGTKSIKLFAVSGSSATTVIYPLKSTVRVNGSSEDASSVAGILKDNADTINAKMPSKNIENGEYGQLIKYTTTTIDGVAHISEIYTIDSDDLENGDIVPGLFKTTSDGNKEAFSDGNKLTYNSSSSKSFTVGGSDQFVINSSTVVILVPKDRTDEDEFKKRTSSYFSNGNSYVVEPYDVTGNVAKVVLVYTTGSNAATVYSTTTPVFIQRIGGAKNEKGKDVDKIYYYNAGDEVNENSKPKEILTSEKYIADGVIDSGDIVKLAIDDGEVTKIQKVFVDGVLYDYTDGSPFETFKATGNMITHAKDSSSSEYYQVVLGTVDSIDGESLMVVPQIVDNNDDYNGDWKPFTVVNDTRFYMFDADDSSYSTQADLGSLSPATNNGKVDAVNASKVVLVKLGTLEAVYILDAYN